MLQSHFLAIEEINYDADENEGSYTKQMEKRGFGRSEPRGITCGSSCKFEQLEKFTWTPYSTKSTFGIMQRNMVV